MTLRQRFFYLIGVYVFCGFLRAVMRETLPALQERVAKERRKAEVTQMEKDVLAGYPIE